MITRSLEQHGSYLGNANLGWPFGQTTYDFMVQSGQLKPMDNWKQAYTLQFVKDLKVMP